MLLACLCFGCTGVVRETRRQRRRIYFYNEMGVRHHWTCKQQQCTDLRHSLKLYALHALELQNVQYVK